MTIAATAVDERAPEQSLIRAQAGDDAAFAELVELHGSMVYSIAFHACRNRALAEEIAQDVFLSLYRNLARIRSADHLANWLRRATTNRVIDWYRARRRTVALEDAPELAVDHRHGDPWLLGRLHALFGELSVDQRLVLTLRYQEELGPTAIASALGLSVNTVKSHLTRALAKLREKLVVAPGASR